MSSLAATQADGYYIPPSYIESGAYKKQSISQHAGSKGHNQFLQRSVCRFELPFDGFCTGCHAIVGKGTRFNTHKAHVDDYFTTKIYEFTTRCRACGKTEFKIRTNPKERTFDYVSGLRKKVEDFDTATAGTHGVIDTDFGNGILQYKNGKVEGALDPNATQGALHLLEKNVTGHRKAQTEHERMETLIDLNSRGMGEDYALVNANIRSAFRKDRKSKRRRLGEAAGMGLGRGIELDGGTEEDAKLAKMTMMSLSRGRKSGERAHQSEKDKFRSVRKESIFGTHKKKSSKHGSGLSKSPKEEVAKIGKIADFSVKKPRPKQKILIGGKKKVEIYSAQMPVKDTETTSASPGDGALAALSNFYASDSD